MKGMNKLLLNQAYRSLVKLCSKILEGNEMEWAMGGGVLQVCSGGERVVL